VALNEFRIVVLTCDALGIAAAGGIAQLPRVGSVLVVRAPDLASPWGTSDEGSRNPSAAADTGADTGFTFSASSRSVASVSNDDTPAAPADDRITCLVVDDLTSSATAESIRAFRPTLGVLVCTPDLPPEIFSLPELGSISLHKGKAPEYRGPVPGFWELYNGESRVGVTVHWAEPGIDSGAIIRQENLPFHSAPPGDPFEYIEAYRREVLGPAGLRLLVASVEDVIAGRGEGTPQDHSVAVTWKPPNWWQRRELRRRVANRRSRWRRQGKRGFGWFLFRTGLYRRFTKDRAFIVLFHRVDDRYLGNPISCGTREFEEYCAFFSRYFDVVSASELVDCLERGDDISGKLVITFDDGYADNVAAAETMRRYGLNGCFFVTTDYIGTDRDGPWDVVEGRRSWWMDWDDARKLIAMGCEIGSHTATHVDLGVVGGETAVREIRESRDTLEAELGRPVAHFGYPYGGRVNMTAENVRAVRAAGYRTCMSAYGGVVTPDADLFDLRRFPVSPWHRSAWQLGLEMLMEGSIVGSSRTNAGGTDDIHLIERPAEAQAIS
jgi:peptidoglycan/xylan/chitin deacetylase (PgdA/CDA1 family)